MNPTARTSVHGCRPTSPTQRPTRHNCKKEIYQSSFRTYEKNAPGAKGKVAAAKCLQGQGQKRRWSIASPRDSSTRHLDGQNLKVTFWTGRYLSRTGARRGPSITVHADFVFVLRACPSMPCYHVIKTATKLVTDNVANTTGYYYVKDILCVLQ